MTQDGFSSYELSQLEPNTAYAFHVQIFVNNNKTDINPQASSNHKQSLVKFFRTKIDEISRVVNLKTAKKTINSITLSWDVIKNEEDLLDHFALDIITMPDLGYIIDERDYCLHPIELNVTHKTPPKVVDESDETWHIPSCCDTCTHGIKVFISLKCINKIIQNQLLYFFLFRKHHFIQNKKDPRKSKYILPQAFTLLFTMKLKNTQKIPKLIKEDK